ncbi:MAG: sigma factor-like helix-turn-helix DNA-binding protein [Planococcus donghaensis]
MKGNEVGAGCLVAIEPEKFVMENRNELLHLMCELEVLDRDILIRRFFLGMENEEIAIQMGLTASTVDNRIIYAVGLRNHWVI